MSKTRSKTEELTPLRPVGLALAAVVAGLGASGAVTADAAPARAPLEPVGQDKTFVVDPTNHPGFEEDSDMVIDASDAMEPFAKR
jgi:hypothetical protein